MRHHDVFAEELRNPTTTEPKYTDEEFRFLMAMKDYKERNRRPYPTWREVLAVVLSLGYRRVAEPGPTPEFLRGYRRKGEGQ